MEDALDTPYGLELNENCLLCQLRQENFFCALPQPALEAFERLKFTAAYPAGAVLFVEGQTPRGVYLLCRGRVKLSTTSSEGKTLILKIVHPGELLGLHATVSNAPYEITAETAQPCQLNFIKREDFLRFLEQHGEACLRAAQHLSQDCHAAYQQIRSLGLSHSAPERLARLLLEWATDEHVELIGEATSSGKRSGPRASGRSLEQRIKVALTHEEIAQIIGTSRETVTRTLADFRKKQIATLKGSTLVIQNRSALERLIGA